MELFDQIYKMFLLIVAIMFSYRTLYMFISFFFKSRRFKPHEQDKVYAIMIPARNEEKVLPKLIDSIHQQTYDSSKIKIFVVADNCTDNTAEVASKCGAIVYERFNKQEVSKGYALQYLMKNIEKDYGIETFDGYFVFDADNLIKSDFIQKMHDAFSEGHEVVISYRNTKNFDTNYISAAYGIHFYRNTFSSHRPRSVLRLSTNITGTGFLVQSKILKDGWNWVKLTEDLELSMQLVSEGKSIVFCQEAQLYDEQPVDLKTTYKQRIRWCRGGYTCFFGKPGRRLFLSLLRRPQFQKYDMFLHSMPIGLISFLFGLAYQITKSIMYYNLNNQVDFLSTLTAYRDFFVIGYVSAIITGIFILIREHKSIHCNFFKLMFYLFIWPFYDLASYPISLIVLFKRVEWKPIIHSDDRSIESLEQN